VKKPHGEGAGGPETFARVWTALEAELDWARLGRLHCHEGGDDFFGPDERAALFEAGLRFADDLGGLAPGGRSLYVGASVAELVPILAETLVLGRDVAWHEVAGPVTTELTRALEAVQADAGVPLTRPSTAPLDTLPPGAFDHVWMVSVLTDPDHFPALHDRLYERVGTELGTGRGNPARETARAEELVAAAVRRLAPPARFTTTDEELPWVRAACEARLLRVVVPEDGRLSAVVGDVVRGLGVLATGEREG